MLPPSDELHLSGGDPLARRDLPNTSTPARASRPGARAAHGPDAAADVRRFDEPACSGRGCPAHRRARARRPSPTRAKDKSSWEGAEHRSRRGAASYRRPALRVALAELPFWDEIGGLPPRRVPLPLALGPDGVAGSAVSAFRAFLGRTAADFVIFGEGDPPEERPWLPTEPFGPGSVGAFGRPMEPG
jgi:hypothetical protein